MIICGFLTGELQNFIFFIDSSHLNLTTLNSGLLTEVYFMADTQMQSISSKKPFDWETACLLFLLSSFHFILQCSSRFLFQILIKQQTLENFCLVTVYFSDQIFVYHTKTVFLHLFMHLRKHSVQVPVKAKSKNTKRS